jgi:uncharacterized protein
VDQATNGVKGQAEDPIAGLTRDVPLPDPARPTRLAPVDEQHRIPSVDVLRGVAVLGILLLNIVGMAMPDPAYWDPSGWGGDEGWNLRVWWINNVCFEGTMRAIFSMLFGAGVLMFTGKGEWKGEGLSVADAWYRRTIWLFLFGLVHAYVLLWPGEILYAYGLMGMFLFPFRHSNPRRLFALGATLLLAGALFALYESRQALTLHRQAAEAESLEARGEPVPAELEKGREEWQAKVELMQPPPETREEAVTAMQGGFLSAMSYRAGMTYWMHSELHYRYSYFDVLSLMFIGMALYRWGVIRAECPGWAYGLMILVGYGLGLPLNWYETATFAGSGFSLVTFYQVSVTYDAGRLLMVTGHLGVVMLLCRSGLLPWLRASLAAVGRMALTNYLLQTVITTTLFVGFAQFGQWQRYQLYVLVLAIWLFQLLLSPLWLRRFHFGPMEWVWRSLTYQRTQPFARPPASRPGSGTSPTSAVSHAG